MLCKVLHSHVFINMNNCISTSQINYTRGNLYQHDKFREKLYVVKLFMHTEFLI